MKKNKIIILSIIIVVLCLGTGVLLSNIYKKSQKTKEKNEIINIKKTEKNVSQKNKKSKENKNIKNNKICIRKT